MQNNAYKNYWDSLNNDHLKQALTRYQQRLSDVIADENIQNGIRCGSEIRRICQEVLFSEGLKYVWLVPIETSIFEYSKDDFTAYNPYSRKTYALVQSPQIQKEAAAVSVGSNFRIIDCYRGEKTDATHSNIFQQLDVELADVDETEIRRIAGKLVQTCIGQLMGIQLEITDCYSYSELVQFYGTDSPNLCPGLQIAEQDGQYSLRAKQRYWSIIEPQLTDFHDIRYEAGILRFAPGTSIDRVRSVRNILSASILQSMNSQELYAYWVVDMPYAHKCGNGIEPVHHIMTLPKAAKGTANFRFQNLCDEELCSLTCNSFDLIICGKHGAVEVLGGDERISTFALQIDAIERMDFSAQQYAFLLQTLKFNDDHRKVSLGGFAVGIDRLAQFVAGKAGLNYVQLFPTNLPNGEMVHAISIEEMNA